MARRSFLDLSFVAPPSIHARRHSPPLRLGLRVRCRASPPVWLERAVKSNFRHHSPVALEARRFSRPLALEGSGRFRDTHRPRLRCHTAYVAGSCTSTAETRGPVGPSLPVHLLSRSSSKLSMPPVSRRALNLPPRCGPLPTNAVCRSTSTHLSTCLPSDGRLWRRHTLKHSPRRGGRRRSAG
jgi:hypothetical protein